MLHLLLDVKCQQNKRELILRECVLSGSFTASPMKVSCVGEKCASNAESRILKNVHPLQVGKNRIGSDL